MLFLLGFIRCLGGFREAVRELLASYGLLPCVRCVDGGKRVSLEGGDWRRQPVGCATGSSVHPVIRPSPPYPLPFRSSLFVPTLNSPKHSHTCSYPADPNWPQSTRYLCIIPLGGFPGPSGSIRSRPRDLWTPNVFTAELSRRYGDPTLSLFRLLQRLGDRADMDRVDA